MVKMDKMQKKIQIFFSNILIYLTLLLWSFESLASFSCANIFQSNERSLFYNDMISKKIDDIERDFSKPGKFFKIIESIDRLDLKKLESVHKKRLINILLPKKTNTLEEKKV